MTGDFTKDNENTQGEHSAQSSRELPPQWKSTSIKMKRRDQVQAMMGHVPETSFRLQDEVEAVKQDKRTYQLVVVEQPQQCRISGVGDKDRRILDPAPIVQLFVQEDDHPITLLSNPFYVVHASLWSVHKEGPFDLRRATDDAPAARALGGSVSSSSHHLRNLDGTHGLYFSFPDLCVCMTGQFRLKFNLVHLAKSTTLAHVYSEPFVSYTVKAFPGMKESSALSKHLSRQGLRLPVRNQTRRSAKTDSMYQENPN